MALSADVETTEEDEPKKASKMPLIIGLVLALLGAGGGFMATRMGLFSASEDESEAVDSKSSAAVITEDVTFIALDPITVTLPAGGDRQLLRMTVQLDVAPQNAEKVTQIKPRIIDILNTYLRAVQVQDLEGPTALLRLRVQMLHRAQVVAGDGIIRDLLITEFILN